MKQIAVEFALIVFAITVLMCLECKAVFHPRIVLSPDSIAPVDSVAPIDSLLRSVIRSLSKPPCLFSLLHKPHPLRKPGWLGMQQVNPWRKGGDIEV